MTSIAGPGSGGVGRAGQLAGDGLVWLGLIATPLFAIGGGLGFQVLGTFFGLGGLILLGRQMAGRADGPPFPWAFIGAGIAALVWFTISANWSPSGHETAILLWVTFGLLIGLMPLLRSRSESQKRLLGHLLLAGGLFAMAITALDVLSGYALNTLVEPAEAAESMSLHQSDAERDHGRGITIYAVFLPVLCALAARILPRGRALGVGAALTVLLFFAAWLNDTWMPAPILFLALPFIWLGAKLPALGVKLSVALAACSVAFAPIIGLLSGLIIKSRDAMMDGTLPPSWDHRLLMWDHAWQKTLDRLFLGHGHDSSRAMQEAFPDATRGEIPFISLHPHNVGLQIWLETGLIGAVLATLAIALAVRPLLRIVGEDPVRGAGLCGFVVAMAGLAAVSVGAWQYWFWVVTVLAVGLICLIPAKRVSAGW